MFDIGFSEIMVVAMISLIIMGPERLPETVRTITLWLGRLRQFISSARSEIEDEVGVEEIRRQLRNEKIMRDLEKSKDELTGLAKDVTDINQTEIKDELAGLSEDITKINRTESKND